MTRPAFAGLASAAAFLAASMAPSLLPRDWVFQSAVSGIVTAIGYCVGVFAGYLFRRLTSWKAPERVERVAWWTLAAAGPLAVGGVVTLGIGWQRELHHMMGMAVPRPWGYLGAVLVSVILAIALVNLGRGVRAVARRVRTFLGRWLPSSVAGALSGLLVGLLIVGFLDGVVFQALLSTADRTFQLSDRLISEDVERPASPVRSGSPESGARWEDLGSKGRGFVAGGPSVGELTAFGPEPAMEPIRVYAGLSSAETIRGRADRVVAELQRTGAFDREVLCVITTTGTGWVDPQAAAALEYLWGGDTALAALQYSYLPSWLSFLVDSARAREAGAVLFDEVYEVWASLPEADRPLLLVFGESLGADGSEAAFSGVADIRNRTDGVLWVGPPNFSSLWSSFTDHRDEGSLERLPVYQNGATVRFASEPADLRVEGGARWSEPRVLYLQHPSDPVVWWTPRLILRRPDWATEPRGSDVLPEVRWLPLVTFWQLTADMANSVDVPAGHGHNYAALIADGWAAVASPPGWSTADTDRLAALMVAEENAAS